ncbi:MAG: TlpA family protein disulfide reductase [Variovorax sp.]|nr:MAG: TlpA family protein disulfide reductase [Variovorax sp.]
MTTPYFPPAPELQTTRWFGSAGEITLQSLRGQVVMLHFFQMLCPACVLHGLPQAMKTHRLFAGKGIAVIGVHSVFEHHEVMTPQALEAFLHEYRPGFPVGIDAPSGGSIPRTMREYALHGTPSVVLIDRQGRVRMSHFGAVDDMAMGAAFGSLLCADELAGPCDAEGCKARSDGDSAHGSNLRSFQIP